MGNPDELIVLSFAGFHPETAPSEGVTPTPEGVFAPQVCGSDHKINGHAPIWFAFSDAVTNLT
jgi:hypothetical protein